MESSPLPVTTHQRSNLRWALPVIVVALLAVAASAYWMLARPSAFQGLTYTSGPLEERMVYTFGLFGPKLAKLPVSGTVIDYARSHSGEAVIVEANGMYEVYRIVDGNAERVASDEALKSSLAISRDGRSIAYAVRTEPPVSNDPIEIYDPSLWDVMLINAEGTPERLGTGYGPHFFIRDEISYIAYSTQQSIHLVDLTTSTHQNIFVNTEDDIELLQAVISPDGTYVAYREQGAFSLFTLNTEELRFSADPVGLLPEGTAAVAFRGDEVITAASISESQSVLRTSVVTDPQTILTTVTVSQSSISTIVP